MATFGHTTQEAQFNNLGANGTAGLLATSPSDMGTVVSITGYFYDSGGTHTETLAIWNYNGSNPTTLVTNSNIAVTVSSSGFFTGTYVTAPVLSANTQYIIGYVSDSVSIFYGANNSSGTNIWDSGNGGVGTWSGGNLVTNFKDATFYVTYTPSGGTTATRRTLLGVGI